MKEYADHLQVSGLRDHIQELEARNLLCHCDMDQECHGDILPAIANTPKESTPEKKQASVGVETKLHLPTHCVEKEPEGGAGVMRPGYGAPGVARPWARTSPSQTGAAFAP